MPYARLYGFDCGSAYFIHSASGQPIIIDGVDSVVLCSGNTPHTALERELDGCGVPFITIGDCTIARSAEEAIYDGVVAVREFLKSLDR